MKAAEIVGAVLIAGTLVAGAGDAVIASQQWATWGPLAPSQPVPTFATKGFATPGFEAADLTNADLEGDVSMLMFWASWCGACESQMPTIDEIAREYADRGVKVWGVNGDEVPARGVQAARQRQLGFPQVHDSGAARRVFGVGLIPHIVIVGRDGTVEHVHQGRVMGSTLRSELDELLAAR